VQAPGPAAAHLRQESPVPRANHLPVNRRLLALSACAALVLAGAASQAAPPTSSPECLVQLAGSTGVIQVGGDVPTPGTLQGRNGGFGDVAPAAVARTLPDQVLMRTPIESASREYVFALRSGRAWVRPAHLGVGLRGQPWRELLLPPCLDGRVRQLSADHRLLLAVADDGQVYSHDMPGGDLSPERWTWRWGPYFWTGTGWTMPTDVRDWAASELTSGERFTDTSGREQAPIGVATVYLLRGDRRTITYLDPWLPVDDSRQVCGPGRGTIPLAGLSGSGSTVFVVDHRGGLWTRLYDFDVTGANTVFGDYSWQRGRPASDARWQLPAPGWVRHTAPPGVVTDRVSISKTGTHARDRVLRVEGRSGRRTGVWEKPLTGTRWRFVPTGTPLVGRELDRGATDFRFAPDDHLYRGTVLSTVPGSTRLIRSTVTARDVNPECSPVRVRASFQGGAVDLLLHLHDGMRQETRAAGLDDTPREYNGALEVLGWDQLSPEAREWVDGHLGGRRISTAPVALTTTRMRFLAQCWELTLDGGRARADVPRVPVDLGMVVGRTTEAQKDGRTPTPCT